MDEWGAGNYSGWNFLRPVPEHRSEICPTVGATLPGLHLSGTIPPERRVGDFAPLTLDAPLSCLASYAKNRSALRFCSACPRRVPATDFDRSIRSRRKQPATGSAPQNDVFLARTLFDLDLDLNLDSAPDLGLASSSPDRS